jgi:hypothetical protein
MEFCIKGSLNEIWVMCLLILVFNEVEPKKRSMKQQIIFQFISLMITYIVNSQVSITKPTLDVGACSLPSRYFTLGNLIISETQNADFSVGTARTITITAPAGLQFLANSGSILVSSGKNLSGESIAVTSTSITIQFNCSGTNKLDVLTISGINLRSTTYANYQLSRSGGTAIINGLNNGSALTGNLTFVSIPANTYRSNPTSSGYLDWNLASTWECNVVPPNDGIALVTIRSYQNASYNSSNSVYFNGNPIIKSLTIENNANFSPPNGNAQSLTINENFTIQNGGVLQQINWSQSGVNSINIGGNFINHGLMISAGGNGGNGLRIVMNGTTPQIISGTGNFRMIGNGPGAGSLVISNPTGVELQANFITDNSKGNLGTVIVDGLLTFLNPTIRFTGIGNLQLNGKTILKAGTFNEHYSMSGTRVIGNNSTIEFTHPNSSISSINIPSLNLNNLIINNTLTGITTIQNPLNIGGKLSMLGGNLLNGTNTIQLGTSISKKGSIEYSSGVVVGTMKRWFAGTNFGNQTGLFPIGNVIDFKERFVKIEYTQATTGGSLTAEWINQPMGNNVTNESVVTNCDGTFSISNTASGYWTMTPADGITNAENNTYNITLSANNLSDFSNDCHITALKRDNNNIWSYSGIHLDNTGTANNPTITRLNAKGWSNWGLGGEGDPLPVELISMDAKCEANQVNFQWSTASEHNSESFILEKSNDCFDWINSEIVSAAGFSNETLDYSIIDNRISGLNYYRLSQRDVDGKLTIYEPIYIDCKNESPVNLVVWPNPYEDGFNLTINDQNLIGKCTISIKNIMGKEVIKRNVLYENETNLFEFRNLWLPPGTYFIQVSNGHYSSESIKHLIR